MKPKAKIMPWDSIEETRNTRVAIDAFKSLHNILPKNLNGYFKICEHEMSTRGNGSCVVVVLPKMRTETGKNRLLTKEPTFSTDSNKQPLTKYPSCFSKRN